MQATHPTYPANGGGPPPAPLVASWLALVRRRWPWGLAVSVPVMAAAVALVVFQAPIYRADARLRLAEPPPSTGVSPTAGMLGLLRMGGDPFANDLQVLRSRTLREAVVDQWALQVRLVAPHGWHRDSLLVSLAAGRDTERATFEASWTSDGRVRVRRSAPRDSLVGTFAPGEPARFGGVTAVFRPRRPKAPERFRLVTAPFGEAVRGLERTIRTQRASRDANVLDLRYDHADPRLAEGVVATAVERFVALRAELFRRESGETVDSLRVVSGQTLAELREAEDRFEELQRESGLVALDAQSAALVERYSLVLLELETARAELEAVNVALARVEAAENPGQAWISLAAYPRFLENQTVGEFLAQMTLLEQQRIQMASVRTPGNLEHGTVLRQIEALDASLRALALSYRDGLVEHVRVMTARVSEMNALLAGVPALTTEFMRRQRDLRILSEVVVVTEQRLRQEELRQALTFSNVQVIDPPALRDRPVWPRRKLVPAVGLLLAAGFALLGMVVVERADGSVRSARGLAALGGVPLLAAVPAGRRNGRLDGVRLSAAEVHALLRRGRAGDGGRPRLLVAALGSVGDAEAVARAIESAAAEAQAAGNGSGGGSADPLPPQVSVLSPVDSHAAAEAAAREGAPILLVLRAGSTDGREVARVLDLLAGAGAPVVGGLLLCRTAREAHIAWT